MERKCTNCDDGDIYTLCERCGNGDYYEIDEEGNEEYATCPGCGGQGEFHEDCGECDGTGYVDVDDDDDE